MRFFEYVIILHLSTLKYSLLKTHQSLSRLKSFGRSFALLGNLIIWNIFKSSAKCSK